MQEFKPGDVISFPSIDEIKSVLVKSGTIYMPAKVSRRKTIKIRRFLWLRNISISFNLPERKQNIPITQFRRSL